MNTAENRVAVVICESSGTGAAVACVDSRLQHIRKRNHRPCVRPGIPKGFIRKIFSRFLMAFFLSFFGFSGITGVQAMNGVLNGKQQAIVTISAFAAKGSLDSLKDALNEGLEAGLTVNEIKELLVQLYAYAGFPRSLNALAVFQAVVAERAEKGIQDDVGREPGPFPTDRTSLEFGTENQTKLTGRPVSGAIYEFAPAIDQFLKAHLFGDIFQRDNLDWKSRELATVAILAGIEGLNPQLRGHMIFGMHNGLTPGELRAAAALVGEKLGKSYGDNARAVLEGVLK